MNSDVKKSISTLTGIALVAGIWLIISPYIFSFPSGTSATTNNVTFGLIVAGLAAAHAYQPERAAWIGWLNGLLGLWIIASPWVLGFASNMGAMWDNVIVGLIIAVVSVWAAVAVEERFPHGVAT